jgi:hypothetical protein
MGYEIAFKFFKKKPEGFGYDTEGEPETMKVPIGKEWDDVELDEVAKAVFGQMAKRNILIVDAEIYEYTKKKVSFKMKDDGITIKNKKFSYDITGSIRSENEQEVPLPQQHSFNVTDIPAGVQPHELLNRQQQPTYQPQPMQTNLSHLPPEVQAEIHQNQMVQQRRPVNPSDRMRPILPPAGQPLRYETYDPHPDLARVAAQRNMAFTVNKRYPIFEEKPDMRGVHYGMLYVTKDDNGQRAVLNDKHFIPVQNLTNDFTADVARPQPTIRLTHESDNQVSVNGKAINLPDIYTLGKKRR